MAVETYWYDLLPREICLILVGIVLGVAITALLVSYLLIPPPPEDTNA